MDSLRETIASGAVASEGTGTVPSPPLPAPPIRDEAVVTQSDERSPSERSVADPSIPIFSGRRWGTFSWNTSYFKRGNPELVDFLDSAPGREFNNGDLYLNVADYSCAKHMAGEANLVEYIKQYRERVNRDNVIYLTYGDVTEKDGEAMRDFTVKFFTWARSISAQDAAAMETIGISFDVEHMDPEVSKAVLIMCRELRVDTAFGPSRIKIQHTLDGDRNILSTEYVMKYADSALAMLYSNTAVGLSELVNWLLTIQCPQCSNAEYVAQNYKAKFTIMLEASCKLGKGCSSKSMCVNDGDDGGALYISSVVDQVEAEIQSGQFAPFKHLFDMQTLWVIHNFEWYRCYAPFSSHFLYESCRHYHDYARDCRAQ